MKQTRALAGFKMWCHILSLHFLQLVTTYKSSCKEIKADPGGRAVYGLSLRPRIAGITAFNPTEGMGVLLLFLLCAVLV